MKPGNLIAFILILMIFISPFAVWFAVDAEAEAEAGLKYVLYKKDASIVATDRPIYGNSICINKTGVYISRNKKTYCDSWQDDLDGGTIFVPHENVSALVRR